MATYSFSFDSMFEVPQQPNTEPQVYISGHPVVEIDYSVAL